MTEFLWPLTALCGLGLAGWLYIKTLDRLHPEHVPEPSATELMASLDEFKAQVSSRIDNIVGKLEMRANRFGARE